MGRSGCSVCSTNYLEVFHRTGTPFTPCFVTSQLNKSDSQRKCPASPPTPPLNIIERRCPGVPVSHRCTCTTPERAV
eukprot:2458740-Prymnesium_polylepis.1